jgi:hypothetical protein
MGTYPDTDAIASAYRPRAVVEPASKPDRDRWLAARDRASRWVPELSALDF